MSNISFYSSLIIGVIGIVISIGFPIYIKRAHKKDYGDLISKEKVIFRIIDRDYTDEIYSINYAPPKKRTNNVI